MRPGRLLFPTLLLVAVAASAQSNKDDLAVAEMSVPGVGDAVVVYPVEWKSRVAQPAKDLPPTLRLRSQGEDAPMSLQITLLPDRDARLASEQQIARAVLGLGEKFAAGSVEKKTQLVRLPSKDGKGLFARYTDARFANSPPPPGEYRHVTVGVRSLGDTVASFTLLSNDLESPSYQLALIVLADGIHRLPLPAATP